MANSLNRATLIGNVGRDPDTRYMPSGDAVCNLSVATSEKWKDRNTGEQKENTDWHRVAIFGRLAEIATQYVSKGSRIYVAGKLRTRKWQDRDGNDRYTTEVIVDNFRGELILLDSRGDQGGGQGGQRGQSGQQQQRGGQPQQRQRQQAPAHDDLDDDIPF